jgi:hypothetical protein
MDKEIILFRYLEYLNKGLYNFLKQNIPSPLPHNWWDDNIKQLDNYRKDRVKNINLEQLDLYKVDTLLDVLSCSWSSLTKISDKIIWNNNSNSKHFTQNNFNLIKQIYEIRNIWAHENINAISDTTFENYKNQIKQFALFIDMDNDVELLLKKEDLKKTEIVNLIVKKVLSPPLEDNRISEGIRESIVNTWDRIDIQNSAKEVYGFYKDALKAIRGKKIAKELNYYQYLAFEDIENEVEDWYKKHYPVGI